jgi:hypothetical protein
MDYCCRSMDGTAAASSKKFIKVGLFIFLWGFTAWLVIPLFTLDKVELLRATEYFYRSATAVVIMIIIFGKTIFDLLFPQDTSRRKSATYVALLTLYTIALAGGIIFMCLRILIVYLTNQATSTPTTIEY